MGILVKKWDLSPPCGLECVCVYICMYVCMYVYILAHTHTHMYAHTHRAEFLCGALCCYSSVGFAFRWGRREDHLCQRVYTEKLDALLLVSTDGNSLDAAPPLVIFMILVWISLEPLI